MQKVLLKAMNSKRRVLVIRKVGNTLKDSIFELTLKLLKQSGLYEYCKINKSDYTITLPNGSEFLFKGLDDPEKIKSIDGITDLAIDFKELEYISSAGLRVILSMQKVMNKQGHMVVSNVNQTVFLICAFN